MEISLESLGLSKEKIQELVVERLCDRVAYGNNGPDCEFRETPLADDLREAVKERAKETINDIAEKNVLPNVDAFIKDLTLQATNKWGEEKGETVTFVEYLTEQARDYMLQKVDFFGKPVNGRYGEGKAESNRITYAVDQYMQLHMDTAIKNIMSEANEILTEGIQKAVEMKLKEIQKGLKVTVNTGR